MVQFGDECYRGGELCEVTSWCVVLFRLIGSAGLFVEKKRCKMVGG